MGDPTWIRSHHSSLDTPRRPPGNGGHTNARAETKTGILADEPRQARAAGDVSSVSPWVAISPNTKSKEWPRVDPRQHTLIQECGCIVCSIIQARERPARKRDPGITSFFGVTFI